MRTTDIDEVGDNTHLTVFEMLGNWSLGDYFKETSIPQSFGLLTGGFGIDPHSLYVTVFAGDNVFMTHDRTRAGELTTLRQRNVDTIVCCFNRHRRRRRPAHRHAPSSCRTAQSAT